MTAGANIFLWRAVAQASQAPQTDSTEAEQVKGTHPQTLSRNTGTSWGITARFHSNPRGLNKLMPSPPLSPWAVRTPPLPLRTPDRAAFCPISIRYPRQKGHQTGAATFQASLFSQGTGGGCQLCRERPWVRGRMGKNKNWAGVTTHQIAGRTHHAATLHRCSGRAMPSSMMREASLTAFFKSASSIHRLDEFACRFHRRHYNTRLSV